MCEQMKILQKVREKGEINGFGVELAEAQALDYMHTNKKIARIEKDMSGLKKSMQAVLENQARQGGQIDLIVKRMNSPVDEERKDAIFWRQIKAIGSTTTGKFVIVLLLGCVALAGQRILELIGLIQ